MKAQTALALVIVFAAIFLLLGFYGHSFEGQPCLADIECGGYPYETCDIATEACGSSGPPAEDLSVYISKNPILTTDPQQSISAVASDPTGIIYKTLIYVDNRMRQECTADTCRYDFNPTDFSLGSHSYYAQAKDITGAVLWTTAPGTFTIQEPAGIRIAVTIDPSAPAPTSTVTLRTNYIGSPPDNSQSVKIYIDDAEKMSCPATQSSCTYQFSASAYNDGEEHRVIAKILLSSGEYLESSPRVFRVGATPPPPSCVSPKQPFLNIITNGYECCTRRTSAPIVTCNVVSGNVCEFTHFTDCNGFCTELCPGGCYNNQCQTGGAGGLTANPSSLTVARGGTGTVTVTGGTAPYSIDTNPDTAVATVNVAGSTGVVTVTGVAIGSTSFIVKDSSSPVKKTGAIAVTVSGARFPCTLAGAQYRNKLGGFDSSKITDSPTTTKYKAARIFICYDPGTADLARVAADITTAFQEVGTVTKVDNDELNFPGIGVVDVIAGAGSSNPLWAWQLSGGAVCGNGRCEPGEQQSCPSDCIVTPGNRPPVLTSITAAPRYIGPAGVVTMTSVASDPDTISGRREMVSLECGTTGGSDASGSSSGSFSANLCTGQLANNNPGCTIQVHDDWMTSGQRNIFCRARDERGLYSAASRTSVIVDARGPESIITAPPANSVHTGDFQVSVIDSDDGPLDRCFYTVRSGTLSITTTSLPAATVGGSYSASISASGGSDSYTWGISSGALPPGLNLVVPVCVVAPCQAPASISGTPTVAGSYTFTITVASGSQRASRQFTIDISRFAIVTTGAATTDAKLRTCNAAFTVSAFTLCGQQGACTVGVFAKDKIGNAGTADSRSFNIKLIFTNITAPASGWQSRNFSVSVDDRDFTAGSTGNTLTCAYDVYSIGAASQKTVDNAERRCNMPINIIVGPDGDCRDLGEGTCRIVSRVNKTVNGARAEDSQERFFSIDWITPSSDITEAPASWVSSDFMIKVVDDPRGSVITQCQYRVTSNGTETVRWTQRPCSAGSPSTLTITTGQGKNCRHEGGEACTVFVRPLDRAGMPGINDSVSVPVIFGAADTDGFSSISFITTERGLNFSGVTRQELRTATFYVCNRNSNVNSCISAYNSGSRGLGRANFCGSLSGKCEMRCSDSTVSFYFAARGIPVGGFDTVTLLGQIRSAACPVFNIGEISRLLGIFRQLEQDISIQIMETDTFIRVNDETATANNDTLDTLNEALLITKDHLNYMNVTMQDLIAARAQQIITRSNTALDQVNALLRGLRPPTRIRLTVDIGATVRFNRSTSLPAVVAINGTVSTYGRVHCSIIKPGGIVLRNSSGCLTLGTPAENRTTTYSIPFTADRLGQWQYSCAVGRSTNSDCTFEINRTPVDGTFTALPGFDTFIDSISAPGMLLRNSVAVVTAVVKNPDDVEKFANVRCDFTDPQNFLRRNTSPCASVPPNGQNSAQVRMIADRTGIWNVSRCTVFASAFSACQGAVQDNVSSESRTYNVTLPDNVFIESVALPASVINGSRTAITASVFNPLTGPAYVNVTCYVQPPSGFIAVSERRGVEANAARTFAMNITPGIVGTWAVANCTAFKSSSPDFSSPAFAHAAVNPGSFAVVRGSNLTIAAVSVPADVLNGTAATINISVLNPVAARYGRVTCAFRNPANTQVLNSSQCVLVDGSARIGVAIFPDKTGLWNIDACSVFGSVNADCSQAAVHDTEQDAGAFTSGTTPPPPPSSPLFVQNITAPASTRNNTRASVIVHARNPSDSGSYARTGCTFADASQSLFRTASACIFVSANTTQAFSVQQLVNRPGLWTVGDCFINVSNSGTCAPSALHNVSRESRNITVTVPLQLYITSVNAPDSDIVNNTEAEIEIFVANPLSDDRYGSVSCVIEDPNGGTQAKSAPCALVLRDGRYNVSVFANTVGTWNVSRCSVSSSTSSSCAGATVTDEMTNGDVFNVVRGNNLTITSLSVAQPAYLARPVDATYTIRNPSTSERFGRVRCTLARSGQSIVNTSACMLLGRESFASSKATAVPGSAGTWTVTCTAERAFDSSCSSVEAHDTVSKAFEVVQPPNLYIQSIEMPEIASKDIETRAIIRVRNIALTDTYGFVRCTFTNRLNETTRNLSSCVNMSADSTVVNIGVTPELRGNWSVSGCFVNVSQLSNCNQSVLHNASTVMKSFFVSAPLLRIESVVPPSGALVVGDLADIAVSVKNTAEGPVTGFVNCTLTSPQGITYTLTTPDQTLQLNEARDFHPQKIIDVSGRWRVGTCSVYSIRSPPVLESQKNVNQYFEVGYVPPVEECNRNVPCLSGVCENGRCVSQQPGCSTASCPGTKGACYCSNDQCVACGEGYTCQNARCAEEIVIRTCRSSVECVSGECVNGICQQRQPDCYASSDCPAGFDCKEGSCIVPPQPFISRDIIMLLIIVLAVMMVPVILFIYIKRSL